MHCHGEFFHAALLGERRRHSLTTIHWRVDELDREIFFRTFPDLPVAAISGAQGAMLPAANRAGVVHHGIAEDRYALAGGAGGYLAFVGRMTDQKRPDRAIRVADAAGRPIRLAGTVDVGNPTYFEREVRRSCRTRRPMSARSATRRRASCSAAPRRCSFRSTGRSPSAS